MPPVCGWIRCVTLIMILRWCVVRVHLRVPILIVVCFHLSVSKIEYTPIGFPDVDLSRYQDIFNDFDHDDFNGLWNSNAFRRMRMEDLRKNATVVTGKWVRFTNLDGHEHVTMLKSWMVRRFGQIYVGYFSEM